MLGKSLKIKTIAEGVETEEQLESLRELQCDEIQGYYFSKPLSNDNLIKWLRTRQIDKWNIAPKESSRIMNS